MSTRYRRYRGRRKINPIGLLILLSILYSNQQTQPLVWIIVLIWICSLIRYRPKSNKPKTTKSTPNKKAIPASHYAISHETTGKTYSAKGSIMTDCEKSFFETFKQIVPPGYIVQPQINLASIIDKENQHRYRNELFRNIDFGIFNEQYKLVLLIEINDQSHTYKKRIDRDNKVHSICQEAGIPLITFWTQFGINKKYIRKRLSEYLPLCEIEVKSTDTLNTQLTESD